MKRTTNLKFVATKISHQENVIFNPITEVAI